MRQIKPIEAKNKNDMRIIQEVFALVIDESERERDRENEYDWNKQITIRKTIKKRTNEIE